MTAGPRFLALLVEAWVSIGSHPLRTFLAMLGIVIGVGAVVLMMAIGGGSRRAVEDAVSSLGSNILMVIPGTLNGPAGGRIARFESKDATDIALLPPVQSATPLSFPRSFPARAGRFHGDVEVIATTQAYFAIREWVFADGGPFTGGDLRTGARVAVVGATVVQKAFDGQAAVGRMLTINNTPFEVVGTLKPKGQGIDGRDQDDAVFVPITTAATRLWGQQDSFRAFGNNENPHENQRFFASEHRRKCLFPLGKTRLIVN